MSTHPPSFIDETGNIYGSWKVISFAGTRSRKASWTIRCGCGYEVIIKGTNLRKGTRPQHKCSNRCCRECGIAATKIKMMPENFGNICFNCRMKYQRTWKNNNKEHAAEYKRDWNKRSKEKTAKYKAAERKKYQSTPENFLRCCFLTKKRLNKNRKSKEGKRLKPREFTIDFSYAFQLWEQQNGKCAITNMVMTHVFINPCSISMDRIDSDLGYIPDNVQLVCRWVNLAKNNFSDDIIREVLQKYKDT